MPKINVKKSIQINAPVEKVFNTLNDFHNWKAWSPWLITDPEATVTVNDDGKYYEWNGKRTGSGNMTVTNESAPNSVDYDLLFLKPWKSKAKVRFEFAAKDGGTEVSWFMDSSLPFFMFWMKKMMTAFIGMDYERGLNMLKEYIEDGEIKSKLEFLGDEQFPGGQFIGIKRHSTMDTFGPEMAKDFEKLMAYVEENKLEISGYPFSQYHKFDMVKQKVDYTGGVPVNKVPDNLPADFIVGNLPASKVHKVRHIGAYKHLGNAWTTLYTMQRNKEFKSVKNYHPFEMYINSPGEVAEKDLKTDICFAVK